MQHAVLATSILSLVLASGCITEPAVFVHSSGNGSGRVVSDPAGIDCGETCGALLHGRTTLTAIPDDTSRFAGWLGEACEASGTEPCVLDIQDDTEVEIEARFEHLPMMLTIDPPLHGRVTGPDLDCGETCVVAYPFGTDVRIMAVPDPGYALETWSDGSKNGTRLFSMNKNVTLGVAFASTARLVVIVLGTRVTSEPAGIDCRGGATTCEATFEQSAIVTLTAHPAAGQGIEWSGACIQNPTPTTCVTMINGSTHVMALVQ